MISTTKTRCDDQNCIFGTYKDILHPGSVPIEGTTITSLDMDVTVDCNLTCDYCFKEKSKKHMPLKTAQDAIIWLIIASGNAKKIKVTFIGGEPLLRFNMIKKLVPFAKRRVYQSGKEISFGMTTNGTIITKEILDFWKKWRLGFHTSIDGCPIVQDRHRHFANGQGTSPILSQNLPKILSIRPNTTARATILPDTVKHLMDSFEYILSLGYRDIAFVPGAFPLWDKVSVAELGKQFRAIMLRTEKLFRKGIFIRLKFFDEGSKRLARGKIPRSNTSFCGAGRGLVLVDVKGDLWPCHRWCREDEREWKLGSIYEGAFNYRSRSLIDNSTYKPEQMAYCETCPARFLCRGGCPAENLENTGSIWKRHPTGCEISEVISKLVTEFHETLLTEKNPVFMEKYYKNNKPRGISNFEMNVSKIRKKDRNERKRKTKNK